MRGEPRQQGWVRGLGQAGVQGCARTDTRQRLPLADLMEQQPPLTRPPGHTLSLPPSHLVLGKAVLGGIAPRALATEDIRVGLERRLGGAHLPGREE